MSSSGRSASSRQPSGWFGGSAAALGEASVAPKRLPILLARSIDDGPGARFLAEACPEAGFALCDIFPAGVPDDLNANSKAADSEQE